MPDATPPGARIRTLLRDVTNTGAVNRGATRQAGGVPPGTPSDSELMLALTEGRIEALGRLYDRYGSLVFSVGLRVLHDRQLAEDVTQDVFLRLWRRPWSYDPERGRFRSWLMSVTRNRAIDERRRVVRRLRVEERADDPVPELPGPQRFHDPQLESELAEQRRFVQEAMTRLPPAQREVIELAYFGGLTQVEIAACTGQPLGTVKTRIRLGLGKLRRSLGHLRTEDPRDA